MKKTFLLSVVSAIAVCAILAGCETDPASERVTINPSSVTLKNNESVELVASGGYDYIWSIESEKQTYGTLSTRNGSRTVYTSRYDPGTNNVEAVVVVISVTSRLPGGSTSTSTNSTTDTPEQWTAEAYLTLL